jgi:hypothetical protein
MAAGAASIYWPPNRRHCLSATSSNRPCRITSACEQSRRCRSGAPTLPHLEGFNAKHPHHVCHHPPLERPTPFVPPPDIDLLLTTAGGAVKRPGHTSSTGWPVSVPLGPVSSYEGLLGRGLLMGMVVVVGLKQRLSCSWASCGKAPRQAGRISTPSPGRYVKEAQPGLGFRVVGQKALGWGGGWRAAGHTAAEVGSQQQQQSACQHTCRQVHSWALPPAGHTFDGHCCAVCPVQQSCPLTSSGVNHAINQLRHRRPLQGRACPAASFARCGCRCYVRCCRLCC